MLLELSYTMSETIPKWPTNPDEAYTPLSCRPQKGDFCTASTVSHHMHNGTHVDAPRHFDPSGKSIDQVPIEEFLLFRAIRLGHSQNSAISVLRLPIIKAEEQNIAQCDILFIYTGYSKLRDTRSRRLCEWISLDRAGSGRVPALPVSEIKGHRAGCDQRRRRRYRRANRVSLRITICWKPTLPITSAACFCMRTSIFSRCWASKPKPFARSRSAGQAWKPRLLRWSHSYNLIPVDESKKKLRLKDHVQNERRYSPDDYSVQGDWRA